ncbi:V-type ATP synthase subunit B [Thiohalorhabdus sp.]|uniref:V-type ATP synthase subunit B n=1 Tax=Thiohalorhabdus sp. TaxID=3094134 RepID=UPI002FC30EC8
MRAEISVTGAANRLEGPLLYLHRNVNVGLNQAVEVIGADGEPRLGRIAALDREQMIIEMLESTANLALADARARFHGEPLRFGVGPGLLGRIFNGVGEVIDGGPPIPAVQRLPIEGRPINPVHREIPREFIETGITALDLLNSLVRGQKLPIFSGSGLPHDRLAIQLAQWSRLLEGGDGEEFAIVFVGMGVPYVTAERFRKAMEDSGALERTALFLNLASDSATQRLLTPRFALTAAEYMAFEEERHVLVVMTDMTNYCEALRQVSASHGEVPSRKGFPGHMYSDLATIYERAGRLGDRGGSLTQVPLLTMPGDDITHPIPDLTGYITEGQMVLDRDLARKDIYPPVAVLPSLSRLMGEGTGSGYTDPDHPDLAKQLYAAYARCLQVRTLAGILGEEGLPELDRQYLAFGDTFEQQVLHQEGQRSLREDLELGWQVLQQLPVEELNRLSDEQIERHIGGTDGAGA